MTVVILQFRIEHYLSDIFSGSFKFDNGNWNGSNCE